MIVAKTIAALTSALAPYREQGKTIGFVPTMGALHEGHVSLIEAARQKSDVVVLSIFVNRLQFGPGEDFDAYPRNVAHDCDIAKQAGCDVVFAPAEAELYPETPMHIVTVREGADVLCGKSRPGHFDGVATIVLKLFGVVQPTYAFFGEKDAQQVAIISQLIREFYLPITLVVCPTVRETDGLARSSRNTYLTAEERALAPVLYEALQAAKQCVQQGERDVATLVQIIRTRLAQLPLGEIDYVEAYTYPSLKRVVIGKDKMILALAYRFPSARLIDHIQLDFANREME
ncbi:pantoate--beta-alanine ligase [Shouchella lonarensis]|uniref:Pantothenate synthetase n=1 Tax=Shouchella lonarensis TaxID=1464122 RepID=A0A1G6HCH0_9BACI|nr:pantoate--beta-alanine ligase [Shouchella lonarensis]SDB91136.1 pantothenate synthetase [Shouchella lonarensis]